MELGFAWEFYVFGGDIFTTDHPGYFTTYYRPQRVRETDRFYATRIVVPRWWINMWFRKSTWDNFEDLFTTGQLRLPTEAESGYVFCQNRPEQGSKWTLYEHGRVRAFNCNMPESTVFILWDIIRPRLQAAHKMEREKAARKEKEDQAARERNKETARVRREEERMRAEADASPPRSRRGTVKRICRGLRELPRSSTWNCIRVSIIPRPNAGGRRAASA
jgi:hypothetical protein